MNMELDTTNTIYVATDVTNGTVHILMPRKSSIRLVELHLDDPDPENTDAAEFKLLETEMEETRIDL